MQPNLSVVIPAYNEAVHIGDTIQAIIDYLKKQDFSWELIVVDDGSSDDTVEIVRRFPSVRLLENGKNMGKGYSVKRGMLDARGEMRLFMDADHSVNIDNLTRFFDSVREGGEIIIASIELPGSSIVDDNYGYRRLFGKWAKWLIRMVAVPGIYDTQRGFKLFHAHVVSELFPLLTIDRWGFDIELLKHAQKKGIRIVELPVVWHNSKSSSVTFGAYFHTLWELIKII